MHSRESCHPKQFWLHPTCTEFEKPIVTNRRARPVPSDVTSGLLSSGFGPHFTANLLLTESEATTLDTWPETGDGCVHRPTSAW